MRNCVLLQLQSLVTHYVDCDDHNEPQCQAVMPLLSDSLVASHESKVHADLLVLTYTMLMLVVSGWSCEHGGSS